jgi:hypothetical protein
LKSPALRVQAIGGFSALLLHPHDEALPDLLAVSR